LTSLQSCVYYM